MFNNFKAVLIPILVALGAGAALFWVNASNSDPIETRIPGMEENFTATAVIQQVDIIPAQLIPGDGIPSASTASWNQFRGDNRDAITKINYTLNTDYETQKPAILWQKHLGEGHSGAAVLNGRVYVLDYDMEKDGDLLRCLSLDDGKDIWQYFYPIKIKRNHGMSRTIPAITEKYCLSLGPKAHLLCFNPIDGTLLWQKDLVAEYGTTIPDWYVGQCPLIENDIALIAPSGSKTLIMALDCASGKPLWEIPNQLNWKMTHSSIMKMDYMVTDTYIYCGSGGVIGFDIAGKVLWHFDNWKVKIANIPAPLVCDNNKILLTGSYNAGAKMIQLSGPVDAIKVNEVFTLSPKVFGSKQQSPMFYKGDIYGIRQDGRLCCMNTDGEILWTGEDDFGFGPCMIINDIIFAMDDHCTLRLVRATNQAYQKLTELEIIEGHDSWAPFAVADDKLILRDMTEMLCITIAKP
ncbi:MAG: PQQ-binding-like beta-propeller repeat protein [Phycisphaerae bacterium]|nr:PQQ-binding-like beta-propeller repeat protein [Phycisphaerae bacterium]